VPGSWGSTSSCRRSQDKARALEEILKREITPEEICYVGDDLVDLPVLTGWDSPLPWLMRPRR
jgi:3-deoxy-D-manno-octulosonate 8-phosphate phosphatase KdsC-like HAD superfamily phosphatase